MFPKIEINKVRALYNSIPYETNLPFASDLLEFMLLSEWDNNYNEIVEQIVGEYLERTD